ncbi:hypothetical protein MRX96_014672 [Rhipicephalus microplus]
MLPAMLTTAAILTTAVLIVTTLAAASMLSTVSMVTSMPTSMKAAIIATLLLITAGHGPGELQSLRMNDAHAAHLLPVHHFTEAVLLTSHSTSTIRHQLPSSTTPSACSDLDSALAPSLDFDLDLDLDVGARAGWVLLLPQVSGSGELASR